jgi:tetratricopeptide (TPR) repeat protein
MRLGYNALAEGDLPSARPLLERASGMSPEHGGTRLEPQVLKALGSLEYQEGNREAGLEMFRQSADTAARIGFVWWEAGSLADLAHVSLELGRMEEAEAAGRRILELARRMGDRAHAVEGLATLASVASAKGNGYLAGWLWGAVEAEEAAHGPIGGVRPASVTKGWDAERDEHLAALDRVRGPEFDQGYREGRGLLLDDAIATALRGPLE